MKNRVVFLVFGFVVLMAFASIALLALDNKSDHGRPEPPKAGIHWAKGQRPNNGGTPSTPNLTYHGGPVMHSVTIVKPIFWGTSWSNSAFAGDKITGIGDFYGGIGGTGYAKSSDEYSDASGLVTAAISSTAGVTDSSAAKGGNQTSVILAEVCKVIHNSPVANGYYPVYVDIKRGNAGFCAWHSAGTCTKGGTPVQFAFFFNLDGDAGCDPQDTSTLHSQGLAAIANVSGHEISEARTDPQLNAWYDKSGQENADKCAWTFGPSPLMFSDSLTWKIQGNWSNAAYNANSSYAGGPRGCIDSAQ